MSVYVLGMVMLLMSSAMGQFNYIRLMSKRGQGYVPGLHKDQVLVNAPIRIGQEREPGSGDFVMEGESGRFTWLSDAAGGLEVHRLELEFIDHDHWPRPVQLRVAASSFEVVIQGYPYP
ncbi:MAG: hypothetical protein QNK37_17690 [Acidobacteriota bacterium]|nr:hypothetical protein [Acidobacteriota bacterium]